MAEDDLGELWYPSVTDVIMIHEDILDDGNKRTALDTTATFYFFNGYDFRFDDEIRAILQQFASDVSAVEQTDVVDYLEEATEPIDAEERVQRWRDDLIETGIKKFNQLRKDADEEER